MEVSRGPNKCQVCTAITKNRYEQCLSFLVDHRMIEYRFHRQEIHIVRQQVLSHRVEQLCEALLPVQASNDLMIAYIGLLRVANAQILDVR